MKALCLLFGLVLAVGAQQPANTSKSTAPSKPAAAAPVAGKPAGVTVNDVVSLVEAGLSDELIITKLRKEGKAFDLNTDDMIRLKKANVSDNVLQVMLDPKVELKTVVATPATTPAQTSTPAVVARPAAETTPSAKPSGAAPTNADLPTGADIGAYFKKAGKWEETLPEVVNWKTGGVIKNIASAGIVKGDVNGHIPGAHTRNSASSPLEVVIYTPEGVAITEYQLIHLHEQPDSREFRTVTGGVMHVSGGATRDIVPFEGTKVANRIYRVLLPHLGAGEYGFLPPGAVTSASSASIGKMYTFRLVE